MPKPANAVQTLDFYVSHWGSLHESYITLWKVSISTTVKWESCHCLHELWSYIKAFRKMLDSKGYLYSTKAGLWLLFPLPFHNNTPTILWRENTIICFKAPSTGPSTTNIDSLPTQTAELPCSWTLDSTQTMCHFLSISCIPTWMV